MAKSKQQQLADRLAAANGEIWPVHGFKYLDQTYPTLEDAERARAHAEWKKGAQAKYQPLYDLIQRFRSIGSPYQSFLDQVASHGEAHLSLLEEIEQAHKAFKEAFRKQPTIDWKKGLNEPESKTNEQAQ